MSNHNSGKHSLKFWPFRCFANEITPDIFLSLSQSIQRIFTKRWEKKFFLKRNIFFENKIIQLDSSAHNLSFNIPLSRLVFIFNPDQALRRPYMDRETPVCVGIPKQTIQWKNACKHLIHSVYMKWATFLWLTCLTDFIRPSHRTI